MALPEVDRAAFLAETVYARQPASGDRGREPQARGERVDQPQPEDRDRQLLASEVFGIAIHRGLETDVRQPKTPGQLHAVRGLEQKALVIETEPREIEIAVEPPGAEDLAVVRHGAVDGGRAVEE